MSNSGPDRAEVHDSTKAAARSVFGGRLPGPRRVLGAIYVGRLVIAAATFLSVLLVWQQASPKLTLMVSLVLVLTSTFTAAAFWYTHLAEHEPGRNFLYGQTVFDALLVTAVVHLTGGADSPFATLYILVICAAAILLPFLGGVLVGMLASVLYMAEVVWNSRGALDGAAMLQLALFSVVALVTGYLGDRLRQTGTALGEVTTELELLRLDTDEILSGISTGILTVDGKGRLVYLNPTAAALLSLPAEQWLGRPVLEALDRAAPGLGWVIQRSQQDRRAIARFETGDLLEGSFVLGVSTTLLERPGGERPAVTAIFQDITERRRIEQLERRAERLEALAELSASLAHEIKNPLASVRSAVEQLTQPQIEPDDREVLSGLVVRESGRLSRLLSEFIDFARARVTTPEPIDFLALVREAMTLVRAHPDAEGRTLVLEPTTLPKVLVRGSADLLHRAVLNLVLNAVQWAGPGGEVRLTLDVARSDILSPVLGALDLVRLRVTDSGPGVDPEHVEQIFNPFFTLRPGGTGLGLALVQRAADVHGGVVFVDGGCPPARGAVFTLCLPSLAAAESMDDYPKPVAEALS